MPSPPQPNGPWHHRFATWFFSLLFGVLVYWLLGFLLRDIGNLKPPAYEPVEARHVDPALELRTTQLEEKRALNRKAVESRQDNQQLVRASTESSRQTMGQLLEIQKLSLEKGKDLTPQELEALAEAKALFLTNQRQFQTLNEELTRLKEEGRRLESDLDDAKGDLNDQRLRARREYGDIQDLHEIKVAALKLGLLVPIWLIVFRLYLRRKGTPFAPLIYAPGIAVMAKGLMVLHEHFPNKLFKYILILISLALVWKALLHLIRRRVAPARDWLLKQYREGYERFLCPVCNFPIRRGPLKFRFWTRRSIKKVAALTPMEPPAEETPYTCPCCGTRLFDACPDCHSIRPTLLPACDGCGKAFDLETSQAAVSVPQRGRRPRRVQRKRPTARAKASKSE